MTRILSFFQVKTVRSAWVFLVGSVVMFFSGAYIALSGLRERPKHVPLEFELTVFILWIAITGSYVVIASWALFSERGRAYLSEQEKIPLQGNRTFAWYRRFFTACFGAAFASWMLLSVVALPFVGFKGLELLGDNNFTLYLLLLSFAWAPIIFRYLK